MGEAAVADTTRSAKRALTRTNASARVDAIETWNETAIATGTTIDTVIQRLLLKTVGFLHVLRRATESRCMERKLLASGDDRQKTT